MIAKKLVVIGVDRSGKLELSARWEDSLKFHGVPYRLVKDYPDTDAGSGSLSIFYSHHDAVVKHTKLSCADYVVYSDTHDVTCVRWNADELIEAIEWARGKLLFSASTHCEPRGPWIELYERESKGPYHYACGGWYAGTWQSVLNYMEAARQLVKYGDVDNNEHAAHTLYHQGLRFSVDSQAKIVQPMNLTGRNDAMIEHRYPVRNLHTGSVPMFLHFMGGRHCMDEVTEILAAGKVSERNKRKGWHGSWDTQ